ncbi:sugar kinase [uncultured Prevotella sp.]|uniref:sugar kinase n=1 Tax=uncultured Prevotella sp. TaxID=159272 RepID=UPI002609D9F8|nr:sugar kinase [uncultured Prevotella sp.]
MRQKIVTFGEIMLRMTRPEKQRIIQGSTWDGYFGGSEANVAVSLAMLGNDVEYVTRLPDSQLGKACLNELRKYNVGTRFTVHGGERMGTYYYEDAAAMRGSSIVYDRAGSSMTTVNKGTISWPDVFADASVFHWSGISCALSQGAADVNEEAVCEAERQGLTISFDINYRKNLWKYGKSAHDILLPLAKKCDIMFGTEGEWQLLTGITPPKFTATSPDFTFDMQRHEEFFGKVKEMFPKCRKMILALRNALSANHHILSGVLWSDGAIYPAHVYDIDNVIDPMGVGDAFIAAYLHALLKFSGDCQKDVNFALTASAVKNSIPGDFNLTTEEEILELL